MAYGSDPIQYKDTNFSSLNSVNSSLASGSKSSSAGSMNEMGSGLMALASGYASLQAASMEAKQFKMQQVFDDLEAKNQKLKARENALFLQKKFIQSIASATTSFADRNIDTGSGIANKYRIESLKNMGEDLQANELNSQAVQNTIKLRISQSKLAENTARNIGILNAGQSFYKATNGIAGGASRTTLLD